MDTRLLHCCCPMCEITRALVGKSCDSRGELRELRSPLVQFTSRWEAAFTGAHRTLRGPRIHLPISPILLTLARRTSGWSEKDGLLSPVLDNIPSDTTVGLLSPQAPENLPSLIYAEVVLRLIPGVHVLHSGGGRWSKCRSTQWYWETRHA